MVLCVRNPNPSILKEYDIRGTFNANLFVDDALWLGQRFGSLVYQNGGRTVTVCRDGRYSSPALRDSLIEGLCATGLRVMDIGIGPTPMSYFSSYHLKADATLMITGSHNPMDDNGIKITLNNRPFFAKSIQNLLNQDFTPNNGGQIIDSADEVFKAYVERLRLAHIFKKSLKIVWDAGNGAAGQVIEALVKVLPEHEHILLFTEIDGTFPNHHPDPSVESNLKHLRQAVLDNACDIGFAFDGDGDRVGVVDAKGRIINGDKLVTIIAEEILNQVPGAKIIADVKCSDTLFTKIESLGGCAVMERTGHAWIKEAMRAQNAIFAGEMSGHMFFKHNYYGFDDGLYAAIFLINLAQKAEGGFVQLVDDLPIQFSTPEYRIACSEAEKISVIENLKQKLKVQNKQFLEIDGVRVTSTYGWWLVRASNTQSVLIVRAESKAEKDLSLLINEMQSFGIKI
jgi:phosphomannomutase